MPRIEYPKNRAIRYKWVLLGVVVLVVIASLNLGRAPIAAAAVNSLPDPVDSNGAPISLVVAQNNNGSVVNAPVTWAKFYIDPLATTGNLKIWNAPFDPCSAPDTAPDWTGPQTNGGGCISDAINSQVRYDFYGISDAQESVGPLLFTLDGQTGKDLSGVKRTNVTRNGLTSNISIPAGGIVSGLTGYKVIYVKAYFAGALGGLTTKLHSFHFETNSLSDDVGYWAQAGTSSGGVIPALGQYAVHYLGPKVNYLVPNIDFDFAPPCALATNQQASLRWYDADATPTSPVDFDFYKIAPGSNTLQPVVHVDNNSNPNLGGNNVFREFVFTAQPGYKYKWIWHNVHGPMSNGEAGNNLQYWLPYDSINYKLSCFNYHSTINAAAGTVPPGTAGAPALLDFANPSNKQLTFDVNVRNIQSKPGPPAFVDPRVYSVPTGSAFYSALVAQSWNGASPIVPTIPSLATMNNVGQFTYRLSDSTPTGTVLCFGDHIKPHVTAADSGIDNDPPDGCYVVKNDRRYAGVVGLNGDVHAGGTKCHSPATPGQASIIGNSQGQSYGEYAVSLNGPLISSFGTTGSGAGSNLRIGKSGSYDDICRADLYKAATTYRTLKPGDGTKIASSGNNYDISGWSGLYYISGDAGIHGTVNNKITIVQISGTLSITGPIQLTNASSKINGTDRSGFMSLGVIAGGDILVNPAATRVDAYLFSDGTIDTCATLAAFAPAGCGNTLQVNGFLMGRTLNFKRLGPNNTLGARVAEQINLNPQLYLNPPLLFDSSSDGSLLDGQGESRPLF